MTRLTEKNKVIAKEKVMGKKAKRQKKTKIYLSEKSSKDSQS